MLVLSLNLHVPVISEKLGFCYVLTLPKTVFNNKCLSGMYSSGTWEALGNILLQQGATVAFIMNGHT